MDPVLACERGGQFFEAVQFDADGILAEARQHVLAQQEHGGGGHGEDRQQDRCEQAVADRKRQGGGGREVATGHSRIIRVVNTTW